MRELPFDLVIEILAMVPVKNLIRFRSVCKRWRSLFQDESFIRKHATHAPSMLLLVHWQPIIPHTCAYEGRRLRMIFQELELNNGGDTTLLFRTSVIGHCDGLFCLMLQDRCLAVWNPTLRELTKVARMNVQQECMMGFGYDHSIQDHKIVLMPLTNCSKALVLTLKSGVSKMIDFPWRKNCDLIPVKIEGTLVGEHIFWPLYARESTIENILSFSVVTETFNYCSGPGPEGGKLVYRVLKVLRGSLCAVDREWGNKWDGMVVWCAEHEKEDKGRIKSWSKILRLTASDIERSTRSGVEEFRLGAVINQAGLLLINVRTREERFILEYNLKNNTTRRVETSFLFGIGYLDNLEEYIATLVPTRPY